MSVKFFDEVHAQNTLDNLWKLCESEELCDVVLIAGVQGVRIPAHRTILAAACSYFKGMFTSTMLESSSKEVKVDSDGDGDIFRILIEYCYTGSLVITLENAVDLLKAAHSLLFSNVVKACGDFLAEQLHLSNCLQLMTTAELYSCESLLEKTKIFILENFMDICEMDDFLLINADILGQLMKSEDLCVSSEEDVFLSLMTWYRHNRIEREKYLDDLLKLVRMHLLERSFLIEQVKPICSSAESNKLYIKTLEWHLMADGKEQNPRKLITIKPNIMNQYLMAIEKSAMDNKMWIRYYCPKRLKWMKCAKDLQNRNNFGFAAMGDSIYFVGGSDDQLGALNTVLCLNLRTMTFINVNPMIEARASCCVAVLNGTLYALGGKNKKVTVFSVEKWLPKNNCWQKVVPMITQRYQYGIGVLNEKLYVIGGNCGGLALQSVECYDPNQNVWKPIAPMHESRIEPGVAVSDGLLYAVGGWFGKSVERYDPQTSTWTSICCLSLALDVFRFCTSFQNKVIVCYSENVQEYNATTNEWKTSVSLPAISNVDRVYAYSGKLLRSDIEEK